MVAVIICVRKWHRLHNVATAEGAARTTQVHQHQALLAPQEVGNTLSTIHQQEEQDGMTYNMAYATPLNTLDQHHDQAPLTPRAQEGGNPTVHDQQEDQDSSLHMAHNMAYGTPGLNTLNQHQAPLASQEGENPTVHDQQEDQDGYMIVIWTRLSSNT